jgi:hypothetical protein
MRLKINPLINVTTGLSGSINKHRSNLSTREPPDTHKQNKTKLMKDIHEITIIPSSKQTNKMDFKQNGFDTTTFRG